MDHMNEIWDSGTLLTHTFDLVFKVILRSFGACLKMACNSKTVGHRVKRTEIGTLGY